MPARNQLRKVRPITHLLTVATALA
jgi:hypothetical protein